MEKPIVLLFVACFIVAAIFSGVIGLATGISAGWKPSHYVTTGGDCWVRPQGDPLYDAHYASNVNIPNCQAFKVQEQARRIAADAYRVKVETTQGVIGVYIILGVVAAILGLFTVMVVRG